MKENFIKKNKSFSFYVVTLLGVGNFSKFPGTLGSLVAIPSIFYLSFYSLNTQLIFIFVLFLFSWFYIKKYLISIDAVNTDPKEVVIDEFLGMHIAFIGINFNFTLLIVSFALFRFFDILKPFPISYIDKNIKGAGGILFDDILAAMISLVILQFIVFKWAL